MHSVWQTQSYWRYWCSSLSVFEADRTKFKILPLVFISSNVYECISFYLEVLHVRVKLTHWAKVGWFVNYWQTRLDAVPIREKLSRCFSIQSLKVQQCWNLNPTFCRWWLESTDLPSCTIRKNHKSRRLNTACCVISRLNCATSSKLIPDETTTCQDGFNLSTNLGPYLLKLDWHIRSRDYLTFSCVSIPMNLAILPSKKGLGEHPHPWNIEKKTWRLSSWYLNGTIGKWCVFFNAWNSILRSFVLEGARSRAMHCSRACVNTCGPTARRAWRSDHGWHNSQKVAIWFVRGHDEPIHRSCVIYFPGLPRALFSTSMIVGE